MLTVNDWAQITVIVTLLSSLAKPLLEQAVPGFKTSSPMHDNLLRVFNLALCLAGVLWVAGSRSGLTFTNVIPLLYYTAQQFVSSQGLYFISTRAGQSVGTSALLSGALDAVGSLAGLKTGVALAVGDTNATASATASPATPTAPVVNLGTVPLSLTLTPPPAATSTVTALPATGSADPADPSAGE